MIAIGDTNYTQAMWVFDDAGHAWARVTIPAAIAQHTVLSSITASAHGFLVGGGFYPKIPPAAKVASVPRIWSVTINETSRS